MAYTGDYKTWVQNRNKITMTQANFRCGQQGQHVSMLGLQYLCAMQSQHDMAIDANEIHMAQISQVQQLSDLDQWMCCSDQSKIAKINSAKSDY